MSPYRANPFFSTTSTFFLPSVGDRVDKAIDQSKQFANEAQQKAHELAHKADMKLQDGKEAAKHSVSATPTGLDLYSR